MSSVNPVFRAGEYPHLNACVGRNGGPYNYAHYAGGFFLASQRLIDSLAESNWHVDELVYPIAFNFRQGLELWLKHLAEILPRLWGEDASLKLTHGLKDNWTSVRAYLVREKQFDPDGELIVGMDSLIEAVIDADPRGEVFRYPVARTGEAHLLNFRLINVAVLQDAVQFARKAFEWWDFSAGVLYDSCYGYY
jgi:hypothetical protein